MVQKPGKKLGVSLVYQGEQGTGKSWFIESLLESLLGKNYVITHVNPPILLVITVKDKSTN